MSHTCSSALIRCIDFRLTKMINSWMEEKGIMNDCDVISIAGISKNIAEENFLLSQIKLSADLHKIQTLYLIHHTDCGAYGGQTAFPDLETEKKKYIDDMNKAKEIINKELPDLEVKLMLANVEDGKIKEV